MAIYSKQMALASFLLMGVSGASAHGLIVAHNAHHTIEHAASTSSLLLALCIFGLALYLTRFRRVLEK
jgi:hypothetical protein